MLATAAAEETEVALTVPFEAEVAFVLCSIGLVAAGTLAPVLVSRSDASGSFGSSAEMSPGKQFVSIKPSHGINSSLVKQNILACRRLSKAADADPPNDKIMYIQKSQKAVLPRPVDLLSSMILVSWSEGWWDSVAMSLGSGN